VWRIRTRFLGGNLKVNCIGLEKAYFLVTVSTVFCFVLLAVSTVLV